MKLKINITKEILRRSMWCGKEGEEESSYNSNCAIALAVRDFFPEASVTSSNIFPSGRYSGDCISLPLCASRFIELFDRLHHVGEYEKRLRMDEISFEVEVPDKVIEKIDLSEARSILASHPSMELIEE